MDLVRSIKGFLGIKNHLGITLPANCCASPQSYFWRKRCYSQLQSHSSENNVKCICSGSIIQPLLPTSHQLLLFRGRERLYNKWEVYYFIAFVKLTWLLFFKKTPAWKFYLEGMTFFSYGSNFLSKSKEDTECKEYNEGI